MVPTAAGGPDAHGAGQTHPRLMTIANGSAGYAPEHPKTVYVHARAVWPDGANGALQLPWFAFVSTPLPASELTIAVTTGCSESGLVGVGVLLCAISLIGWAPATMAPSCAACSIFCFWLKASLKS